MVPRRLQIGRDPQPRRRNSLKSHSEAEKGKENTEFDAPVAAKLHHSHQTWSVCRMHTRRRRTLRLTSDAPPLLPQQIRWSGLCSHSWVWQCEKMDPRTQTGREAKVTRSKPKERKEAPTLTASVHGSWLYKERESDGVCRRFTLSFFIIPQGSFHTWADGLARLTLLSSTEFTPNTLALRYLCVPLASMLTHLNNNSFSFRRKWKWCFFSL